MALEALPCAPLRCGGARFVPYSCLLGYYPISPHDTHREYVPRAAAGGMGTVSGYLVAQLAVDRSVQGRGLGGELLLETLITIAAAARTVGGRLVVVDARQRGCGSLLRAARLHPHR